MKDMSNEEKEIGDLSSKETSATCCQSSPGNASACCGPQKESWGKGKAILAVIVIIAAILVGANSFVRGTSRQSDKTSPTDSFSATLNTKPAAEANESEKARPVSSSQKIIASRPLDSLQALDTLAADKDVVFIVLPGQGADPSQLNLNQLEIVLNKLSASGRKIGAFTLRSNVPDHGRLVQHFSIKSFPCVLVLGRGGSGSAVSGDISETQLLNAFVVASTPGSCCPTPGTASCCPK